MDPQIEELKELVRRNIALTEENNRILRGIRRSSWISTALRVLWWGVILGATFAAWAYFAPFLQDVIDTYSSLNASGMFQNFRQ